MFQLPRAASAVLSVTGFAVFAFVAGPASAQSTLLEITGLDDTNFGDAIAALDDVNGDGVPDLAVGESIFGSRNRGRVRVYSGLDGSVLSETRGPAPWGQFGHSCTRLRDIDGDGMADLIVSAILEGTGGVVRVYSGRTMVQLLRIDSPVADFLFGYSSADLGDVDGDGTADLVIGGYPQGANVSGAYVYSGSDGSLIYRFESDPRWNLGRSVAGPGDVDGDGRADILISKVFGAELYSGRTGALLRLHPNDPKRFVDALGDVDGDRVPDYGLSDPDAISVGVGRAVVVSGASGLPILDLTQPSRNLGSGISSLGDVTGDGFGDFLVGASGSRSTDEFAGRVHWISGSDGRRLYTVKGEVGEAFGRQHTTTDLNGDGLLDVAVGALDGARALVLAGNDLFLRAKRRELSGGDTLSLNTASGTPGSPAALFVTAVNGNPTLHLVVIGVLDVDGVMVVQRTVPTGLAGLTVTFQSFAADLVRGILDTNEESVAVK